ncbi:MAG TPA: DUF1080 domain-containing protein [Fimbriimonadaceae bacterium]|nr:DUF1080 domain-containing protein [Fimbriimonadaceae bacterium]
MLAAAALLLAVQGPSWSPLFDGKTLDAFEKKGGAATFKVEHGEIVGSTAPNTTNTFLCTKKVYGDFELEFDVNVDPDLNSGVQIRSHAVPGYKNGVVFGYQVEIDPSTRGYSGGLYDESRRGWLQDLSKNEKGRMAFKNGQWNHYRVLAVGSHIQIWVNGVQTTDYNDDVDSFGFIGLQVHAVGDRKDPIEVRWRNLRIRDMGVPGAVAPKGATVLLGGASDVSKWKKAGTESDPIGWTWHDGYLEVTPRSGSIQTKQTYGTCKLHVEFMVDDNGMTGQANGNSGVYLQGRYEVQVLNSAGQEPANNICGAIYGVKAEDYNMSFPAYQWQTYDIQFTAPVWKDGNKVSSARFTVYHNGTLVHKNVEVTGPTGSGQAETMDAGGLLLQDHGNRIKFRNVWILPR